MSIPVGTGWLLGACMEARGRQDLWIKRQPEVLAVLREQAIIQSVESSNRIEGVTIAPARLRPVVLGNATPRDRSEEELASSSSERLRGVAFPRTTGRSRSGAIVTPSMRFDDSTLWMIACSRRAARTSGFCLIHRSCLPRASMQAPRSQPVPTGIDSSANASGFREGMSDHLQAEVA